MIGLPGDFTPPSRFIRAIAFSKTARPIATGDETIYADFVTSASNLVLNAYTHDDVTLGREQQRIIGLINRMRLFAPPDVMKGAEDVLRSIVEISLKPSIELRRLAQDALTKSLDPDPLLKFSVICRKPTTTASS